MEMDTSKSDDSIELPDMIAQSFTKEQFLHKFKLILSESLGSQDIEDAWIGYIETIIEPCGWMAVWIPSSKTAEHYECPVGRAGSCVVEVHDVEPRNFLAEVQLLKTPNCVNIEDKDIRVDIAELYPLSNQANSEFMNIAETAEALTLYRCFYKHIWRPWDGDDNIPNWVELHLAARLNLMMDHTSKTGNYSMAKRLHQLASEAQKTKDEISELEETAVDLEDEEMDDVHAELQKLAMRAHEITHEAKLLDDPLYGKLNYSALKAEKSRKRKESRTTNLTGIILVWNTGPVQEMASIINTLSPSYPDETLHVAPSLEHALDIAIPGDTVVLGQPGPHLINSCEDLGRGGFILMGLDQDAGVEHSRPVICPSEATGAFIVVSGDVVLKNIIIDLSELADKGFVVEERGSLSLKNTVIKNGEVGIELKSWCKASLEEISITNFNTGILTHPTSSLVCNVVEIKDCDTEHKVSQDEDDSDSVFVLKSAQVPFNKDKVMRDDFHKLSRLNRISSSTPKSEVCLLDTAKANISLDNSQSSFNSCSTTAADRRDHPKDSCGNKVAVIKSRGFPSSTGGESTDSCSSVSDSCISAPVGDSCASAAIGDTCASTAIGDSCASIAVGDSFATAADSDFGAFLPRLSTTSSCFTVSDSCASAGKASLDSVSTLMES